MAETQPSFLDRERFEKEWEEDSQKFKAEYETTNEFHNIQNAELRNLVKEFFDEYLDYEEVHGFDEHVVKPIGISCCRAMMVKPLGELLMKMRKLSHAP